MNKVTAIIPVRSGSRRLKNKNILSFGDSNLLINKIRQLKKVQDIYEIIVSSDSNEYLNIAKTENVKLHKREIKYADDISVPFGETVKNICKIALSDHILWSPVTSPLTNEYDYTNAIKKYFEVVPNKNDSLVSFEILKYFLWNDNGPINYGLFEKHVLSQDLPNIYHPTNGIFIAPREKMIEWKYFHGKNPYKFILNGYSSVDIDDELDYIKAKAYYEFMNKKSNII